MKLWGISEWDLRQIVKQVSDIHYEGNVILDYVEERGVKVKSLSWKLRTVTGRGNGTASAPGARRSWSGRRMPAACWHAHRDVMAAVFAVNPEARIKSGLADYRGVDDFESKFEDTGDVNIGSMMKPVCMPDLCECECGHDEPVDSYYDQDGDWTSVDSMRMNATSGAAQAEIAEWEKILRGRK